MELVINMPDTMYDWLKNGFVTEEDYKKLWEVVKNGTPLEPHGNLIDREKLLAKIIYAPPYAVCSRIYNAHTIIPATKEGAE